MSMTGRTIAENLEKVKWNDQQDVVRPATNPITPTGGVVGLKGNLAPDGHGEHYGAWPADVYYGDVNGAWTDNSVWSTGAAWPRNHNVPGDGKFDQTTIPSQVELA